MARGESTNVASYYRCRNMTHTHTHRETHTHVCVAHHLLALASAWRQLPTSNGGIMQTPPRPILPSLLPLTRRTQLTPRASVNRATELHIGQSR